MARRPELLSDGKGNKELNSTNSKLRLIFYEATRACNLGCPHCRASAHRNRSPEELSTEEAKKFIGEAASFSEPIFVFSGGEPLLRGDIYELILYASRLGLKAALATNATLINEDVAKRLMASKISLVSISIYGATAASHDSFCGEAGANEMAMNGIAHLRAEGMPFQINTTITKKNLDELEAIGAFALRAGAVAYHVFFLVPTGRGKFIEGDELSPWEYEAAFNRLYDFQLKFPLRVKATCAPHYNRVAYERRAKDEVVSLSKGCLAGSGVCFVSYKGEVFGCGYLPIPAGDLRRVDFKTIWSESPLFGALRDDSNLQGKCGSCEFKGVCGGCRARAYATTGNYLGEEPECVYQPLTARF